MYISVAEFEDLGFKDLGFQRLGFTVGKSTFTLEFLNVILSREPYNPPARVIIGCRV